MASGPNVHSSFEKLFEDTRTRVLLVERRLATQGGGGSGASAVAPGMIQVYGGGSVPAGWLLCDGAAISRTQYSALFNAIGTTYGAGDGSTTFNVPDLRGRVPVGRDGSQVEFDVLGEKGGVKTVALTETQMPRHQHNHDQADGGNLGYEGDGTTTAFQTAFGNSRLNTGIFTGFKGGPAGAPNSSGPGEAHTNLQPYLVTNYIIATSSGSGIQPTFIYNQGNTTQRNSTFGIPANATEQVALANKNVSWFNTDLGWDESYFATFGMAGLTTNKQLVTGSAPGWYPVGLGPVISVVPSSPQTMTTGATFTNWTQPGTGLGWRKGGAAYFTLASGVITCVRPGRYNVRVGLSCQQGAGQAAAFMVKNGSTAPGNVLDQSVYVLHASFSTKVNMEANNTPFVAGDTVRWYAASVGSASFGVGGSGTDRAAGEFVVEYVGPSLVSE
jgi:microcystin-dependent protein